MMCLGLVLAVEVLIIHSCKAWVKINSAGAGLGEGFSSSCITSRPGTSHLLPFVSAALQPHVIPYPAGDRYLWCYCCSVGNKSPLKYKPGSCHMTTSLLICITVRQPGNYTESMLPWQHRETAASKKKLRLQNYLTFYSPKTSVFWV